LPISSRSGTPGNADAVAARVAQGDRPLSWSAGVNHVRQLASSAAAITTKFGSVPSSQSKLRLGGAVGADQPGAVHREPHGRFWIATSCTT
jgi:hypothetical protein